MSTVINASDGTPAAVLRRQDDGHLLVGCGPVGSHALPHVSRQASVPRADFLAAVAKECDVIVIDRAELPDITDYTPARPEQAFTAAAARTEAIDLLALAEYLDAHPPVDEAQVEALTEALKDDPLFGLGRPDAGDIARRLVREGWKR